MPGLQGCIGRGLSLPGPRLQGQWVGLTAWGGQEPTQGCQHVATSHPRPREKREKAKPSIFYFPRKFSEADPAAWFLREGESDGILPAEVGGVGLGGPGLRKRSRYKAGSISPVLYLWPPAKQQNTLVTILGTPPKVQVFPLYPA